MAEILTIHFLTLDAGGPMASGSSGVSGLADAQKLGSMPADGTKLRFACNPKATVSYYHRATGTAEKMAGDQFMVTCPKCLASPEFLKAAQEIELARNPAAMFDAAGNCCG